MFLLFAGLIKTLRAINGTSWHDTFLGLWLAALRLVQRVRTLSLQITLFFCGLLG